MVIMLRILAAISIALCACTYEVSYGDCAVHCDEDLGCPDGLACGEEGLCRAAEAETCLLPSDGMGGTITHVGGRTIHTFSASQSGSTFMAPSGGSDVESLVVAGGGGGGMTRGGGGGGAGGLVYAAVYAIDQPSYIVMVGYGGGPATNGGNSSFGTIVAIGGGAGRPCATPNGGSGGGADHGGSNSGTGTTGQGNRGGLNGSYNLNIMTYTGAGGGGAGGQGTVGAPSSGGSGGPGLGHMISGTQVFYAGGGGGGDQDNGSLDGLSPGIGGIGGGGEGGLNSAGKDAVNGTGGGGGGGGGGDPSDNFYSGGHGGTGVVIISYVTSW